MAIAAQDGSEIYVFNQRGDHLRTLSALNGALMYRFNYASVGVLSAVEDAYGNSTKIERDTAGFMTAVVAPHGQRTTFKNNDKGYPTQITNPADEATTIDYSPNGQLTAFTDGQKNSYRFTTDANGVLSRFEGPAGDSVDLTQTSAADNARLSWTTAMERRSQWQVERTADGAVAATNTDAAGLQTQIQRNGESTKLTYPDGRSITQVQQADPRWGVQSPVLKTLSLITPGGRKTAFSVNRTVALAESANPLNLTNLTETATLNGHTYKQVFDAKSRQMTLSTPAGRRMVTTLDEHGRAVNIDLPGLFPISFAYDAQGRLAGLKQGQGTDARFVSVEYSGEGWLSSVTAPLKRTVRFEHDAAGRISKRILADGSQIILKYDANDNLTSITPPGRPSHSFKYSPIDTVSAYLPPHVSGAVESAGKKSVWNSITSFVANMWSTIKFYFRKLFHSGSGVPTPGELGPGDKTYTYNKDGQLTAVLRPVGSNLQLAYDNAGRVTAIKGPNAESRIAYDSKSGLRTNVTSADGVVLAPTYDGALLTRLDWSGPVKGDVAFTYNNDLRPSSTDVNDASPVKLEYDADGLLTRAGNLNVTRDTSNGLITQTTLGQLATAEEYNGFAEPVVRRATYGTKDIFADRYKRDALGRVVQKSEMIDGQNTTYEYAYDLAGRLTDVTVNGTRTARYDYDPNGNRISYTGPNGTIKASYDDQDRLLQYGSASYAHTLNCEWLSKTEDGKTTTYSYDAFGNLKGVSLPDGTKIDYLVDGLNRRVGKKVNGKPVQGFVYQDQLKVVGELDGANKLISRFVYARDSNVPDYMVKAGKTYRIITDGLGSPRLVIDADTGAIAQRMDYDEFGNMLRDTNSGFQPFGFAGGIYDQQTSLTRFGARDYDARTGSWTARDSLIFLAAQPNLFLYASQDPINFVDPAGLDESFVTSMKQVWSAVAPDLPTWAQNSVKGGVAAGSGAGTGVVVGTGANTVISAVGAGASSEVGTAAVAAAIKGAALEAAGTTVVVGVSFGAGYAIGSGIDAAITGELGQPLGDAAADADLGNGENIGDLMRCMFSDDPSGCSGAEDLWHCYGIGSGDASGCGSGTGDIHMETFDGLRYDLQAAGEFLASQDPTGKNRIQIRLEPNASHWVSYCTAVAASVDGAKVAIHVKPQPQVYIDGKAVTFEPGRGVRLGKGGEIRLTDSSEWIITWPDNTGVRVKPQGSYLDVVFRRGSSAGKLVGLLGNGDGNPTGDLVTRDGAVLEKQFTSKDLYGRFADSWRISQGESLFHYAKGESTATFTDRTVPRQNVTVDTLDPKARAEAERQCRAAGITAAAALSNCIIDFAVTGDRRFLSSAAFAQAVRPDLVGPPSSTTVEDKQRGSLMVSGTGKETYNVLDSTGKQVIVNYRSTNSATEILPGTYTVVLNGSQQRTEVSAGQQAVVRAGSLLVSGTGKETYNVAESTGNVNLVNYRSTNSVTELLPGTYTVVLNGAQQRVDVTAGQQAVVRAGSLMVSGTGKETYNVAESTGKINLVNYRSTNSATELLPGAYTVVLNGTQQRVDVTAGQQAVVRGGSLMVSGTGKETYNVDDSTGKLNLVNYRSTNSATELLPGAYTVVLNGTQQHVDVTAGQQALVRAGSLIVSGNANETYDVLDSTGKATLVNYRHTNSATELLPGTYVVQIGDRKVTVNVQAGRLTPVNR